MNVAQGREQTRKIEDTNKRRDRKRRKSEAQGEIEHTTHGGGCRGKSRSAGGNDRPRKFKQRWLTCSQSTQSGGWQSENTL